jgi:hypothetical protein
MLLAPVFRRVSVDPIDQSPSFEVEPYGLHKPGDVAIECLELLLHGNKQLGMRKRNPAAQAAEYRCPHLIVFPLVDSPP